MGQRLRNLILTLVLLGSGVVLWILVMSVRETDSSLSPPSSIPGDRPRVKVEVLNGGGVSGVAWAATEVLRDQGFDVVFFGNAENFTQDSSVALDRVHDLNQARAVAGALGIPRVLSEPDSTLFVDVTVRLGPEWSRSREPAGSEREFSMGRNPRRGSSVESPPGTDFPRGP